MRLRPHWRDLAVDVVVVEERKGTPAVPYGRGGAWPHGSCSGADSLRHLPIAQGDPTAAAIVRYAGAPEWRSMPLLVT
jgi:hypothetical protein